MLVVDVFPTPALALKSVMFAQLDRPMVQIVNIVKTFWLRQCAIYIRPLDLVCFVHFSYPEELNALRRAHSFVSFNKGPYYNNGTNQSELA